MLDRVLFSQHLDEGEELSAIIHKHWIIGLKELFWPSFWFLVSFAFLSVAPNRPVFLTFAVFCVVTLVWLLRNFFDYYLDAWIITDQGIIDLAWMGWFHRQSTRILYSDVHGVSYEKQGIAATIFGYGSLTVEKISTGAAVSLPYVKRPRDVSGLILRNMETYLHSKNMKNETHVREILANFVSEHLQRQQFADSAKSETREVEPIVESLEAEAHEALEAPIKEPKHDQPKKRSPRKKKTSASR